MDVDAEHKTWGVMLPYMVFACIREVPGTTQMIPFGLVHRREATTTLDAMLNNVTDDNNLDDVAYLQRAEA